MALTINNNISSMNSRNNLNKALFKRNSALEKLSSGLRINKGADDPSGLLISELMRSQLSGMERALRNTQETNNVMSIAEGGLGSVSSMLTKMRGLAIHALNSGVTSGYQVQADQMELNSALSTINRVVSSTNYAGQNLLNGARDFTHDLSNADGMINQGSVNISSLSGTAVNQISMGYAGSNSAPQAERAYLEADFGAPTTSTAQEFTITGDLGSRTFSFAEGTSVEDMAKQINASADSTGVNAYAVRDQGSGATMLRIASAEYGSNANVRVQQNAGTAFAAEGATVADSGQDARISVNGTDITTDGLTANIATGDVSARIGLNETAIGQTGYDQDDLVNAEQYRTGSVTNIRGGMQLQLGEGAGGQNRQNVSLGNYNPAMLGRVEYEGQTYSLNDLYGGSEASLANNPELALRIIDQAITDVSSGRANIGAFQANALDTNANNLMVAIENMTATESSIRDTDMAEAMTNFIASKLLENAALRKVQASNMNANNVAKLLGT